MLMAAWHAFGKARVSLSPKICATLYVLMIPTFAFVYWYFLEKSFYAPYAKLEAAASADVQQVAKGIDDALHRQMTNKTPMISGLRMTSFYTEVIPGSNGTRLDVTIAAVLTEPKDVDGPFGDSGSIVLVPMYVLGLPRVIRSRHPIFYQLDKGPFARTLYLDPEASAVNQEIYAALAPELWENGRMLKLDGDEERAVQALFEGLQGDPSQISQSFWRMMYFSTTVITTIGFGDIIPMTPVARLIVAMEGILGIVLAGLFVNATIQSRNQA
jgi:hypothetical protein